MYNVTFKNDYIYSLYLDGSKQMFVPPNGGEVTVEKWGSHIVNVPGMTDMNFIDLGKDVLPQYTNPGIPWTQATWGGLIRYSGLEVYFRYEGQGQVQVYLDKLGSARVRFASYGGMVVSIDDLYVS